MKTFALSLALLALTVPAGATICSIDNVPSATLLLPYFEVDLDHPDGVTTLFSVNNASATAVLAHVVIWSDLSVPVLDFNIYLTGYDVQTINLRDPLVNGMLTQTASVGQDPQDALSPRGTFSQDVDFGSCTGQLPLPPLPRAFVTHLQSSLTGQASPILGNLCAGRSLGDRIARGYVTIDAVSTCTLRFPGDPGYFAPGGMGDATNQNVLWGDSFRVNPGESLAEGQTLVHIEASATDPRTSAPGQYTFYGRYVSWTAADNREPLATNFAVRYIKGGTFDGGTDLFVWRDSKVSQNPFPCPTASGRPAWFPLGQEQTVEFDEQENPEIPATVPVSPQPPGDVLAPFPAEAQRTKVGGESFPVPFDFGWLYLDLNTTVAAAGSYPPAHPAAAQGWVTVAMAAKGQFSVGFDAIPLDSASAPHFDVFFLFPPPATCPIDWQPSVLAPVFYGVREYGLADGAPTPSRVFFPSLDGAVWSAPILENCGRYPLIVFVHGNCTGEPEHYKKWFELPAQLARAGYVVVVPELPATMGGMHPASDDHPDLELLGKVMSWMREGWELRRVLLPEPATGIVGHSWGALLGARLAAQKTVRAYVSLSGGWIDWIDGVPRPIFSLDIPMFFTWGGGDGDLFASLDHDGFWEPLSSPKHKAIFDQAAHWDYLHKGQTLCEESRGPCDLTEALARDLVSMFFGKYLPPENWPDLGTVLKDDLIPPPLKPTPKQSFYIDGSYLRSVSQLPSHKKCRITLGWRTAAGKTGSVTKP